MTVDWHEQWALFASNFYDGKAHIELGNSTLLLSPGPGFGDLSHPTTQIMIELLTPLVKNETIVDIGSGSGILSLSALLLGAKNTIGIDIDPEAIAHSCANAALNNLSERAIFRAALPDQLPPCIFLMNMILPEQRQVEPAQWNPSAKMWITSGILTTQRKEYLKQAKEWGWRPVSEKRKGEWLGWIFKTQSN